MENRTNRIEVFGRVRLLTPQEREAVYEELGITTQIRAQIEKWVQEAMSTQSESEAEDSMAAPPTEREDYASCSSAAVGTQQDAADDVSDKENAHSTYRRAGERVGVYTLRNLLGKGGFGEVWLADRKDPYFKVAIKFILPHRVDKKSLARFQLERQVLALLDHPNIAAIYDSGITEDGAPYSVMEFVPGVSLTQYCDREKLTLAERLKLMADICEAVHHAHQKSIIHRDLSPDNILVIISDAKPMPKIIDFGIAKVADKNVRISPGTMTEDFHSMIGKPDYMAPEQAESTTAGIDATADIFSLGVILYELIVGVLPLPREELRAAALQAVLDSLRKERPDPSTRFSLLDPQSKSSASERRGHLKTDQLALILRGRVRHLPMKALRLDRTKRFSSAAAMATDIRNFLANRDFNEAAAEPLVDRAARHVRRYMVAYLAASVAAAIVCVAVGLYISGIRAARAEADRQRTLAIAALKNEQIASANARAAESATSQINTFLKEMLTSPDPESGNGQTFTVREMLDEAAPEIETKFGDQPEVLAPLLLTIGNTYTSLHENAKAENYLRAALQIHENVQGGKDDALAGEIMLSLAHVTYGQEREELESRGVEIYKQHYGPMDPRTIFELNNLSGTLSKDINSTNEQEEEILTRIGALTGGKSAEEERAEISAVLDKARLAWKAGDHSGAVDCMRQFVNPFLRLPVINEGIPEFLASFAIRQDKLNDLETAEPLYLCAVSIARDILKPGDPRTGLVLWDYGYWLRSRNRYGDSIGPLREALENGLANYGKTDDQVFDRAVCLADSLCATTNLDQMNAVLQELGPRSKGGEEVFHAAAGNNAASLIPILIAKGADVNVQDKFGATPLHYCASHNAVSVAKILLKANATIDARASNGGTPLHFAAACNAFDMFNLLIDAGADIGAQDDTGLLPAHWAAGHDNVRIIELVFHRYPKALETKDGVTLLQVAAENSSGSVIAFLLNAGVDVDQIDLKRETALHYAAIQGNIEAATTLLNSGAGINLKRGDGRTALHLAAACNHPKFVELLLGKGAAVNAKDSAGATPMHLAALNGAVEAAKVLIGRVPIDAQDKNGETALHYAAECRFVPQGSQVAQILLDAGASVDLADTWGITPLQHAAFEKNTPMVMLLIAKHALVDARDHGGETALHWTALYDQTDAAAALLDAGANINATDSRGWTPLILAARNGNAKIAALLLRRGADRTIADLSHQTAANVALANGWTELAAQIDPHLHVPSTIPTTQIVQ